MRRSIGLRSARLALTVLAAVLSGAGYAHAGDRVVLVSWDGVRRDILQELNQWGAPSQNPRVCPNYRNDPIQPQLCNGHWSCVPTICSFQMLDSAVVEGKSLTRPQHAQMLTGYGPQETGDITNSGRHSVPEGMTIYERIRAARPDVTTVHIAGRKFVGAGIVRWADNDGALDLDLRRGGRDNYTGDNTTQRFVEALDYVGQNPFFIFVHYKAVDVVGHRAGDKSRGYREALANNDQELGNLLTNLKDRGLLDSTEVYVTTDHGFDGIFHLAFPKSSVHDTWLASYSHNLVEEQATILDVTPTVLQTLGIDLTNQTPPYRGKSLLAGPLP
jgi:hypothetical protein